MAGRENPSYEEDKTTGISEQEKKSVAEIQLKALMAQIKFEKSVEGKLAQFQDKNGTYKLEFIFKYRNDILYTLLSQGEKASESVINEAQKFLTDICGVAENELQDINSLTEIYFHYLVIYGIISKNEALNLLEYQEDGTNKKQFNFLKFIETYGLPEEVEGIGLPLIESELGIEVNNQNKKLYLENLQKFISVIISVESDGYNVANNSGSSAQGYFQYKSGNGKYGKNGEWLTGSFQTALKRAKNRLGESTFNELFGEESLMAEGKQAKAQNPRDLNASLQTILFLVDIMTNEKTIKGKELNEYFKLIIMEGNQWAIKQVYSYIHHTAVKKQKGTQARLEQAMANIL